MSKRELFLDIKRELRREDLKSLGKNIMRKINLITFVLAIPVLIVTWCLCSLYLRLRGK